MKQTHFNDGEVPLAAGKANRRDFLKTAMTAMLTVPAATSFGQSASRSSHHAEPQGVDLLRPPDHAVARLGDKTMVKMQYAAGAWTCPGVHVSTTPVAEGHSHELPIRIVTDAADLTRIHLRWEALQSESLLSIGDHWERSYGDLEWRGTVPDRVMPWYFLTFDGARTNGYGVKTQPSAFCFWQRDSRGISLSIDLRNGGQAARLGKRELLACTVVMRLGSRGEPIALAGQEFCKRMCPAPRLPAKPIFGANDWNYAYGRNTAEGILRDADLIASLAPAGNARPHLVIDDGWQDAARFPSMSDLASQIRTRQLRPGLWIRPLRAPATVSNAWLLPDIRFGKGARHDNLAFDPTHPEALEEAMKTVHQTVDWDMNSSSMTSRPGNSSAGGVRRCMRT